MSKSSKIDKVVEEMEEASSSGPVTLKDRIAQKIKSRAFNPKFLDGKSVLFNLKNYNVDYTVGGALSGRFVMDTPERKSIMKAQGYMEPHEWDEELPDNKFGGMTLMLCETKHAEHRREKVKELARQQAEQATKPDSAQKDWKEGGSKGAIDLKSVEKKTETYVGKTPNRGVVTPD